jgi:hypothetical protein
VTFSRFARFPSDPPVPYLEPEPDTAFRLLTASVTARWPCYLPYGGQHGEPTPHVTVTDVADGEQASIIEGAILPELPLVTMVDHAELIRFDGERWQVTDELPFLG